MRAPNSTTLEPSLKPVMMEVSSRVSTRLLSDVKSSSPPPPEKAIPTPLAAAPTLSEPVEAMVMVPVPPAVPELSTPVSSSVPATDSVAAERLATVVSSTPPPPMDRLPPVWARPMVPVSAIVPPLKVISPASCV